jgi:nitroreductase
MGISQIINKLKKHKVLLLSFFNDYKLYKKFNVENENNESHKSIILIYSHSLEKAFTLKSRRKDFGYEKAKKLLNAIKKFKTINKNDNQVLNLGLATLNKYCEFFPHYKDLKTGIQNFEKFQLNSNEYFGFNSHNKKDILSSSILDFEKFAKSRHSIREYSDKKVKLTTVQDAIDIAQFTPSSCNRQPWNALVLNDDEVIKAKKLLTGFKGFENPFTGLIAVCSNLCVYNGEKERNQVYIDGGLYAMTLTFAMHSKGIATCLMNWSVTKQRDKQLKEILNIDGNIKVIVFIAYGNYTEDFNVTKSYRFKTINS